MRSMYPMRTVFTFSSASDRCRNSSNLYVRLSDGQPHADDKLIVVRCRDDAASSFPAFFESGLCAGRFHPGVYHGRRGAGKGEAPYHREDSSCASPIRCYDRHNIGRADFSLCDHRPTELINDPLLQGRSVCFLNNRSQLRRHLHVVSAAHDPFSLRRFQFPVSLEHIRF